MSPDPTKLDNLRIDRTRPSRRSSAVPLVLTVTTLLLLGAAFVWWRARPGTVPVRTVPAREASVATQTTLLNTTGYVTARREATVSSKVTGKILEVLVEEGVHVESGQVLARVDASNTEASLQLSQAQLEAVRTALAETNASLALAESDLHRQQELAAKNIISPADLDHAAADARGLAGRHARELAEVAVAERQVDVWKQQLDDTVIRAPFAGVVTSKNAQPGEMISPMSAGGFTRTGICTLVDMASLEIEVDVSESYINRVLPGQRVEAVLDAYPDWRIPAHVIAIIPSADRQKATVKVRVAFEQPDSRILPDMGVKVAFQAADSPRPAASRQVLVPRTAVRQHDGHEVVWVARDGRVSPRAVQLGGAAGDDVVIASGLAGGELVVVEGPDTLADGTPISELKP